MHVYSVHQDPKKLLNCHSFRVQVMVTHIEPEHAQISKAQHISTQVYWIDELTDKTKSKDSLYTHTIHL